MTLFVDFRVFEVSIGPERRYYLCRIVFWVIFERIAFLESESI
jgi:hypothetical protein